MGDGSLDSTLGVVWLAYVGFDGQSILAHLASGFFQRYRIYVK
jgi:hypothetical protein